jgi:hypothetical protein
VALEIIRLDNNEFLIRLQEKIERLTGRVVEVRIDELEVNQLQVELDQQPPVLILGSNVLRFSGFARMCVEYSVASIREQRPIDQLEFQLMLSRN